MIRLNKWLPHRCGAIAMKIGMLPFFNTETGERLASTILQLNNVEIIQTKTANSNGISSMQVGFGDKSPFKTERKLLGFYSKFKINPKLKIMEFRVNNDKELLPPGTVINANHFQKGQFIDVKSKSKGKGFAGVMERYHFKGLPASHGVSKKHRHGGSYGQNQDPGRVLPGKKMPGRMGGESVTVQNCQILKIDTDLNLIWVKGSIPGPKGSIVKIRDSLKKPPNLEKTELKESST